MIQKIEKLMEFCSRRGVGGGVKLFGQIYQMKKILALNNFGSKNDLCPTNVGPKI